jgi:hypothetical protein
VKKFVALGLVLVFLFAPVGCSALNRFTNDPSSTPPLVLAAFVLVLLLWGVRKIRPRKKWYR